METSAKKIRIKRLDGTVTPMTYDDLCEELGFLSGVNFVRVTNAGTIDYTCGKPEEVCALARACVRNNIKPSKILARHLAYNPLP